MLRLDTRSLSARVRERARESGSPALGVSLGLHGAALACFVSFWEAGPSEPYTVITVELVQAADVVGSPKEHTGEQSPLSKAMERTSTMAVGRTPEPARLADSRDQDERSDAFEVPSKNDGSRVEQTPEPTQVSAHVPTLESTSVRRETVPPTLTEPPLAAENSSVPEASAEATLPVQPAPRREPSKFDPSSDSKIAAIAVEEKLRELMGRPPPFIERPSARAVAHSDAERTAARMRQNAALDVEKEHAMAALSAAANRSGVVGGIGDNVETLPRYTGAGLSNAPPHYPFLARRQGQEGRVVLRVQVTAAGEASAVSLRQSSGYRRLDDVAVEAIKKWRFAPASRDGLPVAGSVDVPVTFKLTD